MEICTFILKNHGKQYARKLPDLCIEVILGLKIYSFKVWYDNLKKSSHICSNNYPNDLIIPQN